MEAFFQNEDALKLGNTIFSSRFSSVVSQPNCSSHGCNIANFSATFTVQRLTILEKPSMHIPRCHHAFNNAKSGEHTSGGTLTQESTASDRHVAP